MIAGDAYTDGQINNKDKNEVWLIQQGVSGYKEGDFNMDSQVDSSDKIDYWVSNVGMGLKVPE